MRIEGVKYLEKNDFDEMIVGPSKTVIKDDIVPEPLKFMTGKKTPLFNIPSKGDKPVGNIRQRLSKMCSADKREALIDYFLDYGWVESIMISHEPKGVRYIVTNSMGRKLIFKGMPSEEEQQKIQAKYNESRVQALYHLTNRGESIFFTANNVYQGYDISFLPNRNLGFIFTLKTELDRENGGFKIPEGEQAFLREAISLEFGDSMVATGESCVEYDGEEHGRWRYAKADDRWMGLSPKVYEVVPDLFLEHNRRVLENKNNAKEYAKRQCVMEDF